MKEILADDRADGTTARRTFLGALGAAAAAIAFTPRISTGQRPSSAMKALDARHRATLVELELDQVVGLPPLPKGYVFAGTRSYGLYGFNDVNDRQAIFTFHTLEHHARKAPLRVFVAHEPTGHFWRTQRRQPQKDELLTRSGAKYATEYFDGFWEAEWRRHLPDVDADGWNKVDRHALIVRTGRVALAVTGFRSQGIEKEDLIEIARAML